jgi:hypothetical protein
MNDVVSFEALEDELVDVADCYPRFSNATFAETRKTIRTKVEKIADEEQGDNPDESEIMKGLLAHIQHNECVKFGFTFVKWMTMTN